MKEMQPEYNFHRANLLPTQPLIFTENNRGFYTNDLLVKDLNTTLETLPLKCFKNLSYHE